MHFVNLHHCSYEQLLMEKRKGYYIYTLLNFGDVAILLSTTMVQTSLLSGLTATLPAHIKHVGVGINKGIWPFKQSL